MRVVQLSQSRDGGPGGDGLRPLVTRVLIMGLAVFLAVTIVPGIESDTLGAGVAAVLVLTLLNTLIRRCCISWRCRSSWCRSGCSWSSSMPSCCK